MKFLIPLLLLSVSAMASDYFFTKRVDPNDLHQKIKAAGITHSGVVCNGNNCRVVSPSANPASVVEAYIYVDNQAIELSVRSRAIALAKKLKTGMITPAEKDELLLSLCFLLLSKDQ